MNQLVTVKLDVKKDYVDIEMPEITMASTGEKGQVTEMSKFKGGMKLTVKPYKTEDAEFEIIEPKLITNA